MRAKLDTPNLAQSPDIGQNSNGGISNFRTSGQSLIKEICHKTWTKPEKRNTASKKFDDDVMSVNCDVILIFPVYG